MDGGLVPFIHNLGILYHIPATVFVVPFEQEAVRTPEPIWMIWRRDKSLVLTRNSTIICCSSSPLLRGEFRPRQTRQLPRVVDLKGRLLSCQSY